MVVVRCCCYCPLLVVAERVRGTHAVRAPLLLPKNARELCLVGSDARFSEFLILTLLGFSRIGLFHLN